MKKLLLVIIIVIIGAGAYYYFYKGSGSSRSSDNTVFSTDNGSTASLSGETTIYKNTAKNFSFSHPTNLTVTSFDTDGVESVVAYDAETQQGFQIEITPIDEDITALTVERIKQDLPDILIESPQEVILGSNGRGVAFVSDDPAFEGRSREVWFVFNKHLYQVRTYMKYDDLLKAVLNTWQFN
jgi:uncharacterized protein YxeA